MTDDQFKELLSKEDADSFFKYCFSFLPEKQFMIHINYLTPENKEKYFNNVKDLLDYDYDLTESDIDKETEKKVCRFILDNLHLAVPEIEINPSTYIPMSSIIPQECFGMSPDELKNWLRKNKPEWYYRHWNK